MITHKSHLKHGRYLEQLLPKTWRPSDYSPSEGLVEIEDQTNYKRFWVPLKNLFKLAGALEPGAVLFLIEDGMVTSATFTALGEETRRKRIYLRATFTPTDDPPVLFNQSIHMAEYPPNKAPGATHTPK